jgi:hypothetical protein
MEPGLKLGIVYIGKAGGKVRFVLRFLGNTSKKAEVLGTSLCR